VSQGFPPSITGHRSLVTGHRLPASIDTSRISAYQSQSPPSGVLHMVRATLWLGGLAVVVFAAGPLAAYASIVRPLAGFGLFALGILLGLAGTVVGLVALVTARAEVRGTVLRGLVPALFVVAIGLIAAAPGRRYPRINDITTDTANPPKFVKAPTLPENSGRNMTYPGESFARQQQAAYPDLGPARLDVPPDRAFARVRDAARRMKGWQITRADAEAHALEGVDTTSLFHFKDDFVIEVRPQDGGSAVQMRSKSRDGKGDIGANAKRIRAFFARLEG
jgi:uncharacterized protein (DUF1499 family)